MSSVISRRLDQEPRRTQPLLPDLRQWTAADVLALIRERHQGVEWFYFEELRFSTGYSADYAEKRIDAFALNLLPMNHFARYAYEVKVDRSDWLVEKKDPKKRRPWLWVSNRFYFVAPAGVVKIEEVPPECGLVIVGEGTWHTAVAAPFRDSLPAPWQFVASLVRRAQGQKEAGE